MYTFYTFYLNYLLLIKTTVHFLSVFFLFSFYDNIPGIAPVTRQPLIECCLLIGRCPFIKVKGTLFVLVVAKVQSQRQNTFK